MTKKTMFSIAALLFSLHSLALDLVPMNYYHVKVPGSNLIYFDNRLLKKADFKSFQTLQSSDYFATDKGHLYFRGIAVKGFTKNKFKAYSNYLGSDGSLVLLFNKTKSNSYEIRKKKGFKKLSNHYFTDNRGVYFFQIKDQNNGNNTKATLSKVKGLESSSFDIVYEENKPVDDPGILLVRDRNSLYLGSKRILSIKKKAKIKLFVKNSAFGLYATIGDSLYYINPSSFTKIKEVKTKNLSYKNNLYFSDQISLYRYGKRVPLKYEGQKIIKASNLQVLEKTWGLYKNSVFYLGDSQFHEFKDVNTSSFNILRNYCRHGIGCIHLAEDNYNYYYGNRRYSKKPLKPEMKYVLENLPNLRRAVFYPGTQIQIKEADPDSFVAIKDGYGKDKMNFFYYGKKITTKVHEKSFKVLGYGFAKDKNKVFVTGRWLKKASARSFERVLPKFGFSSHTSKKLWRDKRFYFDEDGKVINK